MEGLAADSTLTGGQTLQKCLVVTYNGTTVPASVKLHASSVSGALAPYLTLVVDQGTGGAGSGSCTGFNVGTSGIYSGTLAGFGTAATQFSNGVGSWAPNTIGATQTYRFTITVQNVPGAQNVTAAGVFTCEPRGESARVNATGATTPHGRRGRGEGAADHAHDDRGVARRLGGAAAGVGLGGVHRHVRIDGSARPPRQPDPALHRRHAGRVCDGVGALATTAAALTVSENSSNSLGGDVDEVAVWNRALSGTEISTLYSIGKQ